MTELKQIYKCELCGNIVEVVHTGGGTLVCCGQPMTLLEPKTADTSVEKHVPFIKRDGDKYVVKVGENAAHPMEEKHYIEWIELTVDGTVYKKNLNPGDAPEALFEVAEGKDVSARELCNVHGLWSSK